MAARNIHVIVNPVSGQEPVPVDLIRLKLEESAAEFKIAETDPDTGPRELAQRALDEGADLIIAAGGDGTVLHTAEALVGTGVPLGIIPEGTANVFATDLGIPSDSGEALDLILQDRYAVRSVDAGVVGEEHFLLRVGIGLEAAMTVLADPDLKERYGFWAYLWTVIKLGRRMKQSHYDMILDGRRTHVKGVTCIICNSGNLGLPGIQLIPEIDLSDGYLNVVVFRRATLRTMGSLIYHALLGIFSGERVTGERRCYTLYSAPAREVTVHARPEQIAARDGEEIHSGFPLEVSLKHKALLVAVPKD